MTYALKEERRASIERERVKERERERKKKRYLKEEFVQLPKKCR